MNGKYEGENVVIEEKEESTTSRESESNVIMSWDSGLCLEDQRTLNEWEEMVVEEGEDFMSLLIYNDDEVEVEVDGQSVASGFEQDEEELDEEALGFLQSEIFVAVNNLDALLQQFEQQEDENVADSYSEFQDGYISPADYDTLFGQFMEIESVSRGSPPAAKSFVENLPLVELMDEELRGKDVACAICKDDIVLEEKVRRLPCSHCYHSGCILPWLSIRNTCPVCRFELPTDDPEYEESKMHRAVAHDLLELATQMQF